MKEFFSKILSLPKVSTKRREIKRKPAGQSLVELAIAFPVILILFTGMVEFGFILNYYLSLLDATRESARFYSNQDPFEVGFGIGDCTCTDPVLCLKETAADAADADCDRGDFYQGAADLAIRQLQPRDLAAPQPLDNTRKIILDPAADDVVVVVFDVNGAGTVTRYPLSGDYRFYENMDSLITNQRISDQLVSGAPNTAIVLVEVFYHYHQVLALPWMTFFLGNPILLHAYTMMPMPPISLVDLPTRPECAGAQLGDVPLGCNPTAFFGEMMSPLASLGQVSP